ncbi:MAG: N-formylglutamate amidohydrolase [Planctomycetota bacterium]
MSRCVVSCEHATARVPARWRAAFADAGAVLRTHRAWDPGALPLARALARALRAPCLVADATRLLVDVNRSAAGGERFSKWSSRLSPAERELVVQRHWAPLRDAVAAAVAAVPRGAHPAVHVSVHSFTPRIRGVVRPIDVAWLFDPTRDGERAFVDRWMRAFARREPRLRLRRNAPYRGDSDGHTTDLRRGLTDARYLGIELEVSQRLVRGSAARWRRLVTALCAAAAEVVSADGEA